MAYFSAIYRGTTITTIGKQKPDDASHDYFTGILRLALINTADEYGYAIVHTVPSPGQERTLKFLASDDLYDVIWTADSSGRDTELLKIPFPLFRGGLGWRGMIIHQDHKSQFSAINSVEGSTGLIACQGLHLPDADILASAGLSVARVGFFDAMLQMVELKRCDYLPLSIFEEQAELDLEKRSFPNLIFFQDLVIQYPLTMHFYVKNDNKQLAARLKLGLQRLYDSGEYDKYLKKHPLTKGTFPLTKFKQSRVIKLIPIPIII